MSHKKRSPKAVVTENVAKNVEKKPDTSKYIHQEAKINFQLSIREKHQHTEKQVEILNCMTHKDTRAVCLNSIWGVGKTYCAVLAALKLLNEGKTRKIYYVRNPVESSDCAKIGILPGELNQRLAGYNEVLMEKLDEFLPEGQINKLIAEGYIEFLPPGFIRGRSLNNATLICDESGNLSWGNFMLICSRLGERSRVFFLGDSDVQCDIKESGFRKFYDTFNDEESRNNGVFCFEQRSVSDILRSGFIRFVMEKVGIAKKEDDNKDWVPKEK